jgi:DNA-binding protein HU-beta
MNTKDLVRDVSKASQYAQGVTAEIISATVKVIQEKVSEGSKIKLAGFGTFEVVERAARPGRNPFTGESVFIPAAKHPKFHASRLWKKEINGMAQVKKSATAKSKSVVKKAKPTAKASAKPAKAKLAK